MSKNKKTGKYSQSVHPKISFNLNPTMKRIFDKAMLKTSEDKGGEASKTEVIEKIFTEYSECTKQAD